MSVLLLMLLLTLSVPVAMIALIVYAIVHKRPGVFFGGAAILALLAVAAVMLVHGLRYVPSPAGASVLFASNAATLTATAHRETDIPRIISMFSDGAFHADGWRISFGQIIILAVLALVALRVFSRRVRPGDSYDRRHGWGLGRLILLAIIVMFAARVWSSSKERSAREWAQLSQQQAEHDRREVERAHRHTSASTIQAPADIQASIEQLWDQLNRPKIDLHTGEQELATKSVAETAVKLKAAQSADGAKSQVVDSGSGTTAASFAHSAAQLGQLLAEVSTIAMRVADTSKFISRTLVAVDSPADKSSATAAASPATKTVAATKASPTRETITSAKAVAAKVPAKGAGDVGGLNQNIGGEVPANKLRPAWVDEPQKQVGNVLRQVVVAGPYSTPEECYAKTDEVLKIVTDNYVKHFFDGLNEREPLTTGQEGSPLVKITNFRSTTLERMGIDLAYIRREIAKDEYLETVASTVGPMKNLHTLLEFSPDVEREVRTRWNELRRDSRLTVIGLLSGSVLGAIGLAFGLLKVDTATKGYYSKRLFLGVPAAIIGLVALVALLGQLKH